jgi:hypothetical protein
MEDRDIPDFPIHLDQDLFRLIRETIAMRMHAIQMIENGEDEVVRNMAQVGELAKIRMANDVKFSIEVEMVATGVESVLRTRSYDERFIHLMPVRFMERVKASSPAEP